MRCPLAQIFFGVVEDLARLVNAFDQNLEEEAICFSRRIGINLVIVGFKRPKNTFAKIATQMILGGRLV